MHTTLAYLGPEGTFSSQAARQLSKKKTARLLKLRAFPTIPAIFQALLAKEADFALVPAENSIEGSVTVTMDLLIQDPSLQIQGELVLPIAHHLLSRAQSIKEIRKVLSHPQAIAQCRNFLAQELSQAELVETNSTAEAAFLAAQADSAWAAVGPLESGRKYNLPVLVSHIADYPNNETRFLLIGEKGAVPEKTCKTSLVLGLKKDRPGGLYQVLGLFAAENINLCRIESRPSKQALGKYLFFIDCEAGMEHPGLQRVLAELASCTESLRNLGSYCQL